MKLTEEQVKKIIKKVYVDLNLPYFEIYPINCGFTKKGHKMNNFDFDIWTGSYDYRDPDAVGDEWMRMGSDYIISIDDEKGEAFAYHYYAGHIRIKLNEEGNYEVIGKLFERKEKKT